jgi:hypothetical protein
MLRTTTAVLPIILFFSGPWLPASSAADAPQRVNVDNFRRAETDNYFARFAHDGGFGRLAHERALADIDHQTVIRLNRDTLYSFGVFDLDAGPITVTLPDTGGRFMSLQVISEDHYAVDVFYAPGTETVTKENVGTRYVCLAVRTFVDPNNPDDLQAAHKLQDAIQVAQPSAGKLVLSDWDQVSLKKIRQALLDLTAASGGIDSARMFGRKDQVDPVQHLLGTAAGWGGNPRTAALYVGVTPEKNDGKMPYLLSIKDVPVDGFWSVSVYNKDGYFEKNARNAYTVNNVTAAPEADGSVTIHFGGDEKAKNFLPITPGWNYLLRFYRPRQALLDGAWQSPVAQPVK